MNRVGTSALVALAAAGLGCGAPQLERGDRPARGDAIVLVLCNVPEASLFVDGTFLAPVGLVKGGVALSPGRHRLELRHDAYLGRFVELELKTSERRRVEVELFPILP
jgi:hypothetical protein